MALNRLGSVFAPEKLTQLSIGNTAKLATTDDDGLTTFVASTFNVPKDKLEVVSHLQPDNEGFYHAELRQVISELKLLHSQSLTVDSPQFPCHASVGCQSGLLQILVAYHSSHMYCIYSIHTQFAVHDAKLDRSVQ